MADRIEDRIEIWNEREVIQLDELETWYWANVVAREMFGLYRVHEDNRPIRGYFIRERSLDRRLPGSRHCSLFALEISLPPKGGTDSPRLKSCILSPGELMKCKSRHVWGGVLHHNLTLNWQARLWQRLGMPLSNAPLAKGEFASHRTHLLEEALQFGDRLLLNPTSLEAAQHGAPSMHPSLGKLLADISKDPVDLTHRATDRDLLLLTIALLFDHWEQAKVPPKDRLSEIANLGLKGRMSPQALSLTCAEAGMAALARSQLIRQLDSICKAAGKFFESNPSRRLMCLTDENCRQKTFYLPSDSVPPLKYDIQGWAKFSGKRRTQEGQR